MMTMEGHDVPLTTASLVEAGEIDFDALRHQVILGRAYSQSWGRRESFDEQLDMLLHEFAGQSAIKFAHSALIVALRRRVNVERNFSRFASLWESHSDILIESLDSRWLVSACDTLAEFSPDKTQAQLAAMGSLFVNTLKLYETERVAGPCSDFDQDRIKTRTPLFDGMTAFMVGGGDMVANLISRIDATIMPDTSAGLIVRELISRALSNDTAFSRLSVHQRRHQWPKHLRQLAPRACRQENRPLGIEADAGPGYILLNDTSRLGEGFHFGPNFACAAIRQGLRNRGLQEWGWANSSQGFAALMSRLPERPAVVVLNGEGTLHHGAARARELLQICVEARTLGIPVAVVNTVWQENPPEFLEALRAVNLVHVREGASYAALSSYLAVSVTPDVSILPLVRLYSEGGFPQASGPLAVMDNVVADASEALLDFALQSDSPFFVMPGRCLAPARKRARSAHSAARRPMLLQAPDIPAFGAWVTGRYHGLIAALCADRPVCALPSNTHKVEGMLADAGLADLCLLQADWLRGSAAERRRLVLNSLESQRHERVSKARQDYMAEAVGRIERMFDEVRDLAIGGREQA